MRISDWSSDVCSSDLVCKDPKRSFERQPTAFRERELAGRAMDERRAHSCLETRDGLGDGSLCEAQFFRGLPKGPFLSYLRKDGPGFEIWQVSHMFSCLQAPRDRKSTRLNSSH